MTALSALFYAVSMVRIHQKTQNQNTEGAVTGLAVDKVFFGGVIATVWVLADVIASYAKASGGGELDVDVWQSYGSIEQWLLILFISVGPSALSNVLQFKALSKIKPSEGQVILSTVPLWAILFSVLTGTRIAMGGEALAGLGMICFDVNRQVISTSLYERFDESFRMLNHKMGIQTHLWTRAAQPGHKIGPHTRVSRPRP